MLFDKSFFLERNEKKLTLNSMVFSVRVFFSLSLSTCAPFQQQPSRLLLEMELNQSFCSPALAIAISNVIHHTSASATTEWISLISDPAAGGDGVFSFFQGTKKRPFTDVF